MNHDVPYFQKVVKQEEKKLVSLCSKWQNISSQSIVPEDVCGEIRTAIGLTELLLREKMKQFSGLISDCKHKTGEKEVTCQDLAGFWDMLYYEVEKVNKNFADLEKMKNNNWEFKNESTTDVVVKKAKVAKQRVQVQAKPNSSTKAHILAARQRLAEAKANALKSKSEKSAIPNETEQKENFIPLDVPSPKKSRKTPRKDINQEQKAQKSAKTSVGQKLPLSLAANNPRRTSEKTTKEFIPLACITRSAAKKALLVQNKVSGKS